MIYIGSGYAVEVDVFLDVLLDFVELYFDVMVSFAIFIKVSLCMCKV